MPVLSARSVMRNKQDRLQLAQAVLSFGERLCS
jgi:hypothetical protein